MEKKFKNALLKVLDEKTFKNILALSSASGVDQAGLTRFVNTLRAKEEGKEVKNPTDNLNLAAVSKLVDCLGGRLIFPWESPEVVTQNELIEARKTIEEQREEIIALRAVNQAYERLLSTNKEDSSSEAPPQRNFA